MAEVGLLPFARVALQVATQVLPPYRSRFSKHQFTQPQLLAVLCLMRYEDWTFREAEVRLREHHELRAALQLQAVPDYTTLCRFLRRLEDDVVDRGLQETVRRLRRRRRRAVSAAIDGTGLSHTSVSTFFLRRLEQHAHGAKPRRPWLKWLIVVDVQQQILLAQRARQGPGCDARSLPGLLDVAARGAPLGVVLADAEFDSEANHQHIRQRLGAKSIIPARHRGVPNGTIRNQMFRAFPKKPYRQRAKIESLFSAVKRKLSARAPGRSLATQIRQALLLGLAYNLYRLRHRTAHRGCQQSPSVDSKPLTGTLSPLSATLTKTRRGVSAQGRLTRNSKNCGSLPSAPL
jgi:IS5 family transposase